MQTRERVRERERERGGGVEREIHVYHTVHRVTCIVHFPLLKVLQGVTREQITEIGRLIIEMLT